jgi:hypothetical protein
MKERTRRSISINFEPLPLLTFCHKWNPGHCKLADNRYAWLRVLTGCNSTTAWTAKVLVFGGQRHVKQLPIEIYTVDKTETSGLSNGLESIPLLAGPCRDGIPELGSAQFGNGLPAY